MLTNDVVNFEQPAPEIWIEKPERVYYLGCKNKSIDQPELWSS